MDATSSVDFYRRFLDDRFKTFREKLDALVYSLANHNLEEKINSCKAAKSALDHLTQGIPPTDRPGWIAPLDRQMRLYVANAKNGSAAPDLMRSIIAHWGAINEQKWPFASTDTPSVIFDAVYQKHYDASRVSDLFETLAANLQAMIDAGVIDSVKVIEALKKVIATIRRNRRGSCFSTIATWQFTRQWFRNYLWEVLSDLPALGAALRATRATIEELDSEMIEVSERTQEELQSQLTVPVPLLEYRPAALPHIECEVEVDTTAEPKT